MKFKRFLAVILAAMVVFSLAACPGEETIPPWSEFDMSLRPNLSGLYPNSGMTDDLFKNSSTSRAFEEITGYKVNYAQNSGSNEEAEVGNALLEKNTYSFIKCARGAFDQYVVQDAFLDLTEIIELYGQDLKRIIPANLWEACKYNGKLYAIPEYGFGYMQDCAFVFNTEHLTAAGITKIPETLGEFTETVMTLQTARGGEKNPNYHAFAMTGANAELDIISGAFDMPKEFYEDENGKVKNYLYSDKTYNYIKYMNKLYRAGCLPANWDSAQAAELLTWFTDENISIAYLPYWNFLPLLQQMTANKKAKYPTVEAAKAAVQWQTRIKGDGTDGSVVQDKGKIRSMGDIGYFIAIPYQSRRLAPYVIDWMNTRIKDENYRRFLVGEEGVSYEFADPETEDVSDCVPIADGENGATRYYRLLSGYTEVRGNSMYTTGGNPVMGKKYWPLREKDYDCWEILLPDSEEEYCITSILGQCPILPKWSAVSIAARSNIITILQQMINSKADEGRLSVDGLLANIKGTFEKKYWTKECEKQVQDWYDSKKAAEQA